MSDDSDWGEPEQTDQDLSFLKMEEQIRAEVGVEKEEESKRSGRGGRGREKRDNDEGGKQEEKMEEKVEKEGRAVETTSKPSLDQSNWMEDQNAESPPKPSPPSSRSRPPKKSQTSLLIAETDLPQPTKHESTFIRPTDQNTSLLGDIEEAVLGKELEPASVDSSWFVDKKEEKEEKEEEKEEEGGKKRGNRGNRGGRGSDRGEEKEEQNSSENDRPRRGNRNRDRDQNTSSFNPDFKKKRQYGGGGYGQNQNQQGGNRYGGGRGGYRGGRGGYRGGGRGGYNNYGDRDNRERDGGGNSNYRGGYNNDRGGYNNNRKYREKQEGEDSSNGSENGGYRGNRGWNGGRNDDNRGGYHNNNNYGGNGYQRNNEYNRNNSGNNQYGANSITQPQTTPTSQPTPTTQPPQKKPETTRSLTPHGRKCWPQTTLSILSCHLTLTARNLRDFRCKLLVMPYTTIQMEYYPGNLVNSSEVDYRKKIISKGAELQVAGSVYLQKAIGVHTFEALAFVKIDKGQIEQSLKKGIHEVLRYVQKIQKPITLESVVFPICSELGDPSWVINPFMNQLELCRKVREVWVTTVDGGCYCEAAGAFTKELARMFGKNEIYLD